MMVLALLGWLACTVLALILVDLDIGPGLVSLTMDHGLTVADAVAVALLVAGWLVPVVVARRRGAAYRIAAPGRLVSAVLALIAGAGLLTAALLVPDFTGRRFVVGAFALLVECAAAATALAPHATGPGQA